MRRTVFTAALALLISTAVQAQDEEPVSSPQPKGHMPVPSAEPENARAYAPPFAAPEDSPSAADRGPAQRPFVIADQMDNLASEDNPPTVGNLPPDNIALDRHIRVSLIHDVQNDSSYNGGSNSALLFEVKYINWGAVTNEQFAARRGSYYTISWSNHGPRANFTARFQYRQVLSKEIVRTLVENMPNVKGTVRSYFAVVGKAYAHYGAVASWQFAILRGDTVVAETRSFIW
jgi:hypothetical protein